MPTLNGPVHPAEFWTKAETAEKLFKRKICIAGPLGDCGGPIVGAHTVPRSQLKRIATNGHVYAFANTPSDLLRNNGQFTVRKKGVGQFSVLNFFCADHDRDIFSHIENDELNFDAHQLSLLHYRAMGAELYKKLHAIDLVRQQLDELRKIDRDDARERIEFAEARS